MELNYKPMTAKMETIHWYIPKWYRHPFKWLRWKLWKYREYEKFKKEAAYKIDTELWRQAYESTTTIGPFGKPPASGKEE